MVKFLRDFDFEGKRVFVRADLDVDVEGIDSHVNGEREAGHRERLETDLRLISMKNTVDYLLAHGVIQVIIGGHIKRPKGPDPSLSTRQLLKPIQTILGTEISFWDQLSEVKNSNGKVVLLENLRFWPGEEKNDEGFARQIAEMADVYVNESFAVSHRAHASFVALPALLPHAAGLHLEEEVNHLTKVTRDPKRPFVAIIGGAKIETKIPVVENLSKIADFVLVGGYLPVEIKKEGLSFGQNVIVGETTEDTQEISEGSTKRFVEVIADAKTVVWNGPMGHFEDGFKTGTKAVADSIIKSGAYSIVGGGDTVEFLSKEGLLSKFSFVSNGGGSMLEFLAGKTLPGLKALE